MSGTVLQDALRSRSEAALARLRGMAADADVDAARGLLVELRDARLYTPLAQLAEALCRRLPADARCRRFYAQALIEQGCASAAIDMLKPLVARLPRSDPEQAEAAGLLGRAHKQIFYDSADKTSATAREALKQAIGAYRKPFEDDPAVHTWHGVNLVALLTRARRLGLRVAPELVPHAVAAALLASLDAQPAERRDAWYWATRAEASLGLGDWDGVQAALAHYVADERAQAFMVASTLRQFTQAWDIEASETLDERGRQLADCLRARLLAVGGGEVQLQPQALQQASVRAAAAAPPAGMLEAVLGAQGAQTWKWWKTGLERAASVCAVRTRVGDRIGTGWLVRASALQRVPAAPSVQGLQGVPADELLVMTNFHVVNTDGAHNGIPPESAEVVFEAADANKAYAVREVVWSSPPERHDCSLLRLAEPVAAGLVPLPLARMLPTVDDAARVYVIGHAGGRDLAFSLQDNALLDHEGPPLGQPAVDGVLRVHYRAPTEGGSSGSPVFNAALWEVIALHHSGGKLGMPKLNGQRGTYAANEGIAVQSIVAALGNG